MSTDDCRAPNLDPGASSMVTATRRHRGRTPPPPSYLAHLKALARARHPHLPQSFAMAAPPASYDSRTQGILGPVKDQGQCGSCWDFSGTCLVEVALVKAGILTAGQPLSEEYTLSCCKNGGCDGDDNTTVLQWARSSGLPLSSDYGPYDAQRTTCHYRTGMRLYQIHDWGFVDGGQGEGVTDTALIKGAILTYGAVGCAIAADNAFEAWGEQGPSFDRPFTGSGSTDIDHDVVLVGWKDDPMVRTGGYWILRNSWSPQWGVGGYMAIGYGANLVGTEAVWAVATGGAPPVPPTPPVPPAPKTGLVVQLQDVGTGHNLTVSASGKADAAGVIHLSGKAQVSGTFGRRREVDVTGKATPQ